MMSEETEPTIGTQLRARRIELGRPLSEFAAKTRIRQIYLEALEEDRYEAFPGDAYLAGFLKGYASALGLDPEEMVARYRSRFGEKAGELVEGILPAASVVESAQGKTRERRLMTALLAVLVIVLAVVGYLYYLGKTAKAPLPATTVKQAPAAVSGPVAAGTQKKESPSPTPRKARQSETKASSAAATPASQASGKTVSSIAAKTAPPAKAPQAAPEKSSGVFTIPPGGATLHLEASGATSIVLAIDGRSPQKYDLLPGSTLSWHIATQAHLHAEHPDRIRLQLGKLPVSFGEDADIDFRRSASQKAPSESTH